MRLAIPQAAPTTFRAGAFIAAQRPKQDTAPDAVQWRAMDALDDTLTAGTNVPLPAHAVQIPPAQPVDEENQGNGYEEITDQVIEG